MLLRSSPFCYAKGATPVAGQSPFHGVHWYGMRRGTQLFSAYRHRDSIVFLGAGGG